MVPDSFGMVFSVGPICGRWLHYYHWKL